MDITVTFACPPMSIDRLSRKLRRTHAEPMLFTAQLPTGPVTIADVTIPPTDVHPTSWPPLTWEVDQCEAEKTVGSSYVKVVLLAEPVTVHLLLGHSVAEEIKNCPVTFVYAGITYTGFVDFPACVVPFGGKAVAVTATGTVSSQ